MLAGKDRGDWEADWACLPVDSCQDAGFLYAQPGCHSPTEMGAIFPTFPRAPERDFSDRSELCRLFPPQAICTSSQPAGSWSLCSSWQRTGCGTHGPSRGQSLLSSLLRPLQSCCCVSCLLVGPDWESSAHLASLIFLPTAALETSPSALLCLGSSLNRLQTVCLSRVELPAVNTLRAVLTSPRAGSRVPSRLKLSLPLLPRF